MPLGLVLAAAWLTNAPAAVMIHYSLALLVVFLAWQRRSARLLLVAAGAAGLGACLAAFYLLPAIYEQRWIDIAQAVSAGSRPVDNFLFIHTTDADHDAFNRIISWVALFEMVTIFGAAWAARQWRETKRDLWNVLLGWAIACSVLMFPVAEVLWKVLPKMAFMQFPWRWLLCLSMIFSIFVTVGLRRWWWRSGVCVIAILLVVTGWHRVQTPWWDNADDLREMQDNVTTGVGYEGVDEYTPLGADAAAIDKSARHCHCGRLGACGDSHAALEFGRRRCGVQDVYGADVGAGSVSAAAVSVSGVASRSKRAGGGGRGAGGDGANAGSRWSRDESGADSSSCGLGIARWEDGFRLCRRRWWGFGCCGREGNTSPCSWTH